MLDAICSSPDEVVAGGRGQLPLVHCLLHDGFGAGVSGNRLICVSIFAFPTRLLLARHHTRD